MAAIVIQSSILMARLFRRSFGDEKVKGGLKVLPFIYGSLNIKLIYLSKK
jgi:hypothetical protein